MIDGMLRSTQSLTKGYVRAANRGSAENGLSAGPILWIMHRSQGSIIKNTSPELHKCLVQGGRRVENLKAHLPC